MTCWNTRKLGGMKIVTLRSISAIGLRELGEMISPTDYGNYPHKWKWDPPGPWTEVIATEIEKLSPLGCLGFCCICANRVLPDYLRHLYANRILPDYLQDQSVDNRPLLALEMSKKVAGGNGAAVSIVECKELVDCLYDMNAAPYSTKWQSALLDIYVTAETTLLILGKFFDEAMANGGQLADRANNSPREQAYQLESIKLLKELSPRGSSVPFGNPVTVDDVQSELKRLGWHDDPWIDGHTMPD